MSRKYGLNPHDPSRLTLKLGDYTTADLPSVKSLPKTFGHAGLVDDWQVLLNDQLGDCAIAGALHQEMLWNAEAKKPFPVSNLCAVENYSRIAGYVLGHSDTDQGTDIATLFEDWRTAGVTDADRKPHTIAAYVALTPGDFDELLVALRIFQSIGVGINVPDYAEPQFEDHQPWDIPADDTDPQIVGGHYIPAVARSGTNQITVITWGQPQQMTRAFYETFNTASVAALSDEMLTGTKSIDGVDVAALNNDLTLLAQLDASRA